jgi:hypothetical protein
MRLLLVALLLCLVCLSAMADPMPLFAGSPGQQCQRAIQMAERTHATPPGLLAAIGQVESGRHDPITGDMHPWPWTVDAEGQGSVYDTKEQAIAAVRALQASGVRSIDVGCMQVNLMHHPDAFVSLDQAFDPMANADYAARFLVQLHGQAGAWPAAAGLYHSATPELSAEYQQKVMAVWPQEQRLAEVSPPVALAHAWGATINPSLFPPPAIRRNVGGLILPRVAVGGGPLPPGRTLESYRAAPTMPAWHRWGG